MKKKLSLRVRLCIFSVCLVAFTMLVSFTVSESGFNDLRNEAKQSLVDQSLSSAISYASGKADLIDSNLNGICARVELVVKHIEDMYENPQDFVHKDIPHASYYKDIKEGEKDYHIYFLPFEEKNRENPEILEELRTISSIENIFYEMMEYSSRFCLLSVYTDSGIAVGYDKNVANYVDVKEFNPIALNKEYYVEPAASGESYITSVYDDSFGRGKMITVSFPFFVDGKFKGVTTADILIEDLNEEIVKTGNDSLENEVRILIDKNGDCICYSANNESDNDAFVNSVISNETLGSRLSEDNGYVTINCDGKDYLVVYETADACDWKFLDVLPYDSITAPSVVFNKTIRVINIRMIAVFAILIIIMVIIALHACKKMLRPMATLTDAVSKINDDNIDFAAGIHSGDEIELLANKFEMAFKKVKEYMENLSKAEAERHRIGVELNIATQIQASYIPNIFPPFPNRTDFEIFADMCPAKEVGGDFYDFFFVDENHLGLVIADVSGKGVGAAMFMMISKTFLNGQAHIDNSPSKILYEVNNRLCENNSAEMFVTVWLGILDVRTGKITASNAGHEYPFIQRAGQKYEILKDKHGLALGAFPNAKYTEYEIDLNKGDAIFVYTDGVAEATNAENELFGTTRTCEVLNNSIDASMEQTIKGVRSGIDDFVKDAPQFDDITMLALRYLG